MQNKAKVHNVSSTKQSDYAINQTTRLAAQQKAEMDREVKRREMDALLNVNAGKWRYSGSGE